MKNKRWKFTIATSCRNFEKQQRNDLHPVFGPYPTGWLAVL
jgi:hypothetical protein